MAATLGQWLPFALEGQWRGWAAVALISTALLVFMGSVYMLLASNLGLKVGFHVLMLGFWVFMIIITSLWLFGAPGTNAGTGPRGPEPEWVPFLPETEQAQEFTAQIADFPEGWDRPDAKQIYPGQIDPAGEAGTAASAIVDALVRLAVDQELEATDPADWEFEIDTVPADTRDPELPVAVGRFELVGGKLLFGVQIPATDDHRAITVFAFRDKGRVFQYAAIGLGGSVVMFALHTLLLSRIERREKRREQAPAAREPAGVA